MIKFLKRLIYTSLLLLTVLTGLIIFFISTTPGLYTVIKLSKIYIPGTLKIHGLKGRLLDKFSVDEVEYQNDLLTIKISHLTVSLNLHSLLKQHLLIINNLNADALTLKQKSTITQLNNITMAGLLNSHSITLENFKFNYLNQLIWARLHYDHQLPQILSCKIKFNPQSNITNDLTGSINIDGTQENLEWTAELHGPADVSVNGSLFDLKKVHQTIKWRNVQWPLSANDILTSPEGRIELSGVLPNLNIDVTSKINSTSLDKWQLKATARGILPWSWTIDANLSQPRDPSSKLPGLYTNLILKGNFKDKNHGAIALTIKPGRYQLPENNLIQSLVFEGGELKVLISPKNLNGKGYLALDANKKIHLNFNLPQFDPAAVPLNKQPFSADLTVLVDSLDFLKNMSSEIRNPQGLFSASLTGKGTLGTPTIESQFKLSKGQVDLPTIGLNLNSINLSITGKNKLWEASGSINSAGKTLTIIGKGPLTTELQGEIKLTGNDFNLINTKEYQIHISPDLKMSFSPNSSDISGTIIIPYAQIKPHTFSNSIVLSDDVVFTSNKQESAAPASFNTSTNINLVMGEHVELTFKGLHANLAGTVLVKQSEQGPFTGAGELTIKNGEFKAYGQNLAIEQGQLIFTGGRVENPGINLRAYKTIKTTSNNTQQLFNFSNNNLQSINLGNTIKVGVEVSGKLSDPKIQFFSNPAILSQADILSMIVLGRPANQANKAGGQLLLAAISSMNLGNGTSGTQLLEQLKQNLGFDVNLQTNTNYNQVTNQVSDTTSVVVGKSLSKRIYLSYNVGLSQADPNVLTLKYLLNKFLSIQVSSSDTSNGIDLLYTATKEK